MTDEEMNQMTREELIALAKQPPPQEPCFISEEEEGALQDPPPWARINRSKDASGTFMTTQNACSRPPLTQSGKSPLMKTPPPLSTPEYNRQVKR